MVVVEHLNRHCHRLIKESFIICNYCRICITIIIYFLSLKIKAQIVVEKLYVHELANNKKIRFFLY